MLRIKMRVYFDCVTSAHCRLPQIPAQAQSSAPTVNPLLAKAQPTVARGSGPGSRLYRRSTRPGTTHPPGVTRRRHAQWSGSRTAVFPRLHFISTSRGSKAVPPVSHGTASHALSPSFIQPMTCQDTLNELRL